MRRLAHISSWVSPLPWTLGRCVKSELISFSGEYATVSSSSSDSEFGLAFLDAKEKCNARTRHGSFDTSVIEINKDDLKVFLETMCEAADR